MIVFSCIHKTIATRGDLLCDSLYVYIIVLNIIALYIRPKESYVPMPFRFPELNYMVSYQALQRETETKR